MTTAPLVTVLIPVQDEEDDIARCLEAVAAQTLDRDDVEVLVVDGGSTDATVERVRAAERRLDLEVVVIDNDNGSTPSNLNAGLRRVRGQVVCRVDARSVIPPEYLATCVQLLGERPEVAVTGGRQVTVARDGSVVARGVARALNNSWGMGGSRYRRRAVSGPADTVYLGAFRTAELREAGGWDERLPTNQDFDLNRRMANRGLVWVVGELSVGYLPRPSIGALWRQYHRFGRWKVRYWRLTRDRPRPRQVAALVAPIGAAVGGVVATRFRPARAAISAVAGVAGLVLVERSGRRPGDGGGPVVAATSAVTLAAVWSGWLSGVYRELAIRDRDPAEGDLSR